MEKRESETDTNIKLVTHKTRHKKWRTGILDMQTQVVRRAQDQNYFRSRMPYGTLRHDSEF